MKTQFKVFKTDKGKKYKVTESGTFYNFETPDNLIFILERARMNGTRLKVYLGDNKTGRDWGEESDKYCTIGRSGGSIKIPLAISNSRSHGGGSLLDDCIVKLIDTKTGVILYQHAKYKPLKITIVSSDLPQYSYNLLLNGELYSRHKSEASANRLKAKLS